jgi:hypothetical protein
VAELKISGKGTKVSEATFAVWTENKRKKRAEASRKMVEAELRKKKGGKGLGVLSGRDLFEYKKELFDVPDEEQAAADADEDKTGAAVDEVATKVQSNLFLEGGDDDLDDLDGLEEG